MLGLLSDEREFQSNKNFDRLEDIIRFHDLRNLVVYGIEAFKVGKIKDIVISRSNWKTIGFAVRVTKLFVFRKTVLINVDHIKNIDVENKRIDVSLHKIDAQNLLPIGNDFPKHS